MKSAENMFRLDGKTAMVTGASRGLGLAIARGLSAFGAAVIITARGRERLAMAKRELKKSGAKVFARAFDISDHVNLPSAFQAAADEAGGIDILVNNAGINIRKPIAEAGLDDWERIMSVNLRSVFVLSQCFMRHCVRAGKPGRIINISSLAAESARPGIGIYTASKGAVRQLTKAFAVECGPAGINVNAIGPGYFATEMNKPLLEDPAFDSWVKQKTSLSRWGEPEEVAGAAIFLASEASAYVNGQTIYVDGGWLSKL